MLPAVKLQLLYIESLIMYKLLGQAQKAEYSLSNMR